MRDINISNSMLTAKQSEIKVNSMLDEYSAAVKLVDYGDYSMMQLENMQPLWPQFRHLSMQAISASLAGKHYLYPDQKYSEV